MYSAIGTGINCCARSAETKRSVPVVVYSNRGEERSNITCQINIFTTDIALVIKRRWPSSGIKLKPVCRSLTNIRTGIRIDCRRKPQPVIAPNRIQGPPIVDFDIGCAAKLRCIRKIRPTVNATDILDIADIRSSCRECNAT